MRDHRFERFVFAEKLLSHIAAVECFHRLVFAIDGFFHRFEQQAITIARD